MLSYGEQWLIDVGSVRWKAPVTFTSVLRTHIMNRTRTAVTYPSFLICLARAWAGFSDLEFVAFEAGPTQQPFKGRPRTLGVAARNFKPDKRPTFNVLVKVLKVLCQEAITAPPSE